MRRPGLQPIPLPDPPPQAGEGAATSGGPPRSPIADASRGAAESLTTRATFGRRCDLIALAVLAVVAIIAAATFRDYGAGWDDYTHAQYGDLLLSFYGSGFADRRAFSFVNLYRYGGGFDMAAALLAKALPFDLFETRRLLGAAVGVTGLAVTWRLGRRAGGPLAGLAALVLLAVCPLYYGHMFMNPKDAPFAVAMVFLLLGLSRALGEFPRPNSATLGMFGAGLGLTIGSRIIGGMAALYFAAAALLILLEERRELGLAPAARRMGAFVLRLLPALVLAYLVMALIWPWGVISPLNPLQALTYFSEFFEKPWRELFAGALLPVPDMPRSYVPVNFAVRMPEIFLVLSIGGTVAVAIAIVRRRSALPQRAILALLLSAALLPILFTVATRPAMYNGIRHFVFVTPPLAILGGYAAAEFYAWLSRYGPRATLAGVVVFCLGAALPVSEFVRLHPYQYTHFNAISGGIREADDSFMLDYWGLSFKQAADELLKRLADSNEAPPAGRRRWRIAVCGPHPAAEIALGPRFLATWEPKGADFAMMLGEFYCAELNAPILVEIIREGVVFARVYDIRGRTIPTLFTIPPVQ